MSVSFRFHFTVVCNCCLNSNAFISDSYRKSRYFIEFLTLISHLGTLAKMLDMSAKNKCYMLSVVFTLFHKDFIFPQSIQKMQTCKILPRVKSVTSSKGICLCNNFNCNKQHYNGTRRLKVNQKILQCVRNLYSTNKKWKYNKRTKQCFNVFREKKYNLFKTSNFY